MSKRPEAIGDEYAERWLRNEYSQISQAITAAIREDRAREVSEAEVEAACRAYYHRYDEHPEQERIAMQVPVRRWLSAARKAGGQ